MRIALVFSTIKPNYVQHLGVLFECFSKHGVQILIDQQFQEILGAHFPFVTHFEVFEDSFHGKKKVDLVLSLGGDGTFLKSVLYVKDSNIPILGINMGRLGFLANVNKEKIEEAVERLVNGNYQCESRGLLEIKSKSGLFENQNFALNEFAIHKKDSASMISVEVQVGGEYLNNYWADGLIISTPTGSTGYSLSCGGPIVSPDTPVHILTPIAPHNLNVRPIIVRDDLEIRLKVNDRNLSHLIALDSRSMNINKPTEIVVKKAPFSIQMVQFKDLNFFETIRDKLLWGLDRRN
jgi:NAD+ kinase